MKLALFTLVLMAALVAQAAPTALNCQSNESPNAQAEKIFAGLKLKMELPDTTNVAPGELLKQKIDVTFLEGDQVVTKSTSFKKRGNALSASVSYGEDFGGGDFNLFWDYDLKQIVAVIVVSSDGPMNVDVQRCSVAK